MNQADLTWWWIFWRVLIYARNPAGAKLKNAAPQVPPKATRGSGAVEADRSDNERAVEAPQRASEGGATPSSGSTLSATDVQAPGFSPAASAPSAPSAEQVNPLNCDRDPQRWAREFNDALQIVYPGLAPARLDEGWLISWFANAMMCGEDTYRWRKETEPPEKPSIASSEPAKLQEPDQVRPRRASGWLRAGVHEGTLPATAHITARKTMNATEHLLTKLMEECAEVAQEASKASLFGMDEMMPGQPLTNRERVLKELNDLWAVCEMLNLGVVDRKAIDAKKAKVEKYMAYAESIGTLSAATYRSPITFDDDVAYLQFDGGLKVIALKTLGLDWPPPERIEVAGFHMKRTRMSSLTDEQRKEMTHVCRGAEYVPESSDIAESAPWPFPK